MSRLKITKLEPWNQTSSTNDGNRFQNFPPTHKLENNASSQSMPLFAQQFATKSKKNDAGANS